MAIKTAAELLGNGSGVPGDPGWVPIDLSFPGGYTPDNRGTGFGEPVTAAVANRMAYALLLNDEDLNTRLEALGLVGGAALIGVEDAAFTAALVAPVGGGGIGTPVTELQVALDAIDAGLRRRRAVTATLTDGTNSTGGDFNGASAADVLTNADATFPLGGTFFLRKGDMYEFPASVAVAMTRHNKVFGESAQDATELRTPPTTAANVTINGHYENIFFDQGTGSPTAQWAPSSRLILERCSVQSGTFFHAASSRVQARNCHFVDDGSVSTSNANVRCGSGAYGIYENCQFDQCVGTAGTTIYLDETTGNNGLTFRNCTFTASPTGRAMAANLCTAAVVFENCVFIGTGDPNTALISMLDSYGIVFRDCRFFVEGDQVLYMNNSTAVFENCLFQTGSGAVAVRGIGLRVGTSPSSETGRTAFRNCRMIIGPSSWSGADTSAPLVAAFYQNGPIDIDGFLFQATTGTLTPNVHFQFTGPASGTLKSNMRNVTIDYNDLTHSTDPGGGGNDNFVVVSGNGNAAGATLIMRDLLITGLRGGPALDLDTQVLNMQGVDATNVTVAFTSLVGASAYKSPVIDLQAGMYRNIRLLGGANLRNDAYAWIETFGLSEDPCWVDGLFIDAPHPSLFPLRYVQLGDSTITMHLLIYAWVPPAGFASTHPLVQMQGDRCRLLHSMLRCDYDPTVAVINVVGSRGAIQGVDISYNTAGATVRSPIVIPSGSNRNLIDGVTVTNVGAGTGIPTISDAGTGTVIGNNVLSLD